MKIQYLEVLVMPNGEVIYLGKTLGMLGGDERKHILQKHLKEEGLSKEEADFVSDKLDDGDGDHSELHQNLLKRLTANE